MKEEVCTTLLCVIYLIVSLALLIGSRMLYLVVYRARSVPPPEGLDKELPTPQPKPEVIVRPLAGSD